MELRQLEAFLEVARLGSFTRAAESLHLTQPAITRQIAALETELRTRLFDRLGRTVRPTAAGEALEPYATSILRQCREAQEAVQDIARGQTGRIALGASSTLATYVLPPLLSRFRAQHAGIDLTIRTGISARIIAMVRDGGVDLGLVTTEPGDDLTRDPSLEFVALRPYETCVVTPVGHRLADRTSVLPADLAGEPLLSMEVGTNLRAFADRLLTDAGVVPSITMELDSVEAIIRMVEAGLGVALVPRLAVAIEAQAGRIAPLALGNVGRPERQIALLFRRDKYFTAALRAFEALLRGSG